MKITSARLGLVSQYQIYSFGLWTIPFVFLVNNQLCNFTIRLMRVCTTGSVLLIYSVVFLL